MTGIVRSGLTVPKYTVNSLREIFPRVWSAGSSAFSGWTKEDPAARQCYPTSRVAQVLLGGRSLRQDLRVEGVKGVVPHWINVIDGTEVDFTYLQLRNLSYSVVRSSPWSLADSHSFESFDDVLRRLQHFVIMFQIATKDDISKQVFPYHW